MHSKSFWEEVQKKAEEVDIGEPLLLRRRKAPKQFEVEEGEGYHATTPEQHYRAIYFEAFDIIVACIKDHFNQPGYAVYSNLEKLLVKAATGQCFDDEFEAVMKVYGSDFDSSLLKTQLCIMESRLKSEKKP